MSTVNRGYKIMNRGGMTNIGNVTHEQIVALRNEAAAHGDDERVRICAAALRPSEGDRVVWDVGPPDDHDTGLIISAQHDPLYFQGSRGWRTTIAWDSGPRVNTEQWFEIVPTEAAHTCVEVIREAEAA